MMENTHHVSLRVCEDTFKTHVYVCVLICMYLYKHLKTHVYVGMYICVCRCMYVYTHVKTRVCTLSYYHRESTGRIDGKHTHTYSPSCMRVILPLRKDRTQ